MPGNNGQARLTTTWIKSIKINSSDYDILEQIKNGGVYEVYRDDSTAKQKPNTLINDNPTINDDDEHKQKWSLTFLDFYSSL